MLSMVLFLLMGWIGEERGVRSFVTLLCNAMSMFFSIYFISKGMNPFLMTFVAAIIISFFTIIYQNGVNVKTVASVISVFVVMVLLSVITMWIVNGSQIAGYSEVDEFEEFTMYLSTDLSISMKEVMVCVVLLALLGAIMDTSIAISTAVYEIFRNNGNIGVKELMRSGMKVGGDILGTTVNTLIFAGMGEALMLVLWFQKGGAYSFTRLINSKAFFQEFTIILISNIGCICIIPVSVAVISYLLLRHRKMKVISSGISGLGQEAREVRLDDTDQKL